MSAPDDERPKRLPSDTTLADAARLRSLVDQYGDIDAALARDAAVREIVGRVRGRPVSYVYADEMGDVIALYPEVASMLRDGKG